MSFILNLWFKVCKRLNFKFTRKLYFQCKTFLRKNALAISFIVTHKKERKRCTKLDMISKLLFDTPYILKGDATQNHL